jgi:MFS family permease
LLSPAVIGFYTFTVFFEALAANHSWGRATIGFAITVGTLTVAVSAPIVGRRADRNGARRIILGANFALVMVVASMSVLCTNLPGLYLSMALIGVLTACYMVAVPRVISSWFDSRRGLALGVVMSGTGLGSALLVPLTATVITTLGWRIAYLLLASVVLVVSLPAAFFLLDERRGAVDTAKPAVAAGGRPRFNAQFLLMATAFLLMGVGLHGVLIHFSPILTGRALSAPAAADYFAIASLAMFVGRLGCGYCLDRLPANRVGAVLVLGAAVGIVVLQNGDGGPALFAGAFLFGLGVSAEMDLLSYLISRLYPLEHFSRCFAVAYSAFMVGTSIGPPLLGALYDQAGNYTIGTNVAAGLTTLSALVLVAMRPTPTSSAAG